MQDAFTTALDRWPRTGVPDNPGAWIVTTARNRAIDRIRREQVLADKTALLARLEALPEDPEEMSALPDERLALVFTCCHPALAADVQIALTLREVGGLTTPRDRAPRSSSRSRRWRSGSSVRSGRSVRRGSRSASRSDAIAPGPARRRPPRALPHLQRGLCRERRRDARPARPLQRGDPARQAPLRAHAGRAGGVRAAGADAAAGLAPRRAAVGRRRARPARRPGPRPLGRAREIDEGLRMLDRAESLRRPGPYQLQAAIAAGHAQGSDPADARRSLRGTARSSTARR